MERLIFVYNADSGLFNTLTDMAHKIFSPATYACNLCAITHSNLGMRKSWKEFLETLAIPLEFLHRDELIAQYGRDDIALPAILSENAGKLEVTAAAAAIDQVNDIEGLKQLVTKCLSSAETVKEN